MNCLLLSATSTEVAPFLVYNAENAFCTVLTGGIGLTATSYHLTTTIQHNKPDLIIQAGIAGCFDHSISLGSVFAVEREFIADMGVWEQSNWKDVFDLRLEPENAFPFTRKAIVNPYNNWLKESRLEIVSAISVNQVTTDQKQIETYLQQYNPVIESMEGAALHYIAAQEKIPFLQIRSISNYVGERDKRKWNIPLAIQNLNDWLIHFVPKIH